MSQIGFATEQMPTATAPIITNAETTRTQVVWRRALGDEPGALFASSSVKPRGRNRTWAILNDYFGGNGAADMCGEDFLSRDGRTLI